MVGELIKRKNKKYGFSFTACSIILPETIKVLEFYLTKKNWQDVYNFGLTENILQYRTESASKRTLKELISRLMLLSAEDLEFLYNANNYEQMQLLWFLTCYRYTFIKEFAIEVIYPKYRMLQLEVTQLDYDAFFNEKLNWHEELETITDATRYKLKQILFKMLREAEIIDKNNFITTVLITPQVREIIERYDREYLRIFPN